MAKYELTFLLPEEAGLKKIKEILESLSVKIVKEDPWGEKTLAFPIKKRHSAFFYTLSLELEKSKVSELKKKLNFEESLMRYLLLISSD